MKTFCGIPKNDLDGIVESMVSKFSDQYRSCGMDDDDIRQDVWMSFISASKTFDPDRGVKFTTYVWRILTGKIYQIVKGRCKKIKGQHRFDEEIDFPEPKKYNSVDFKDLIASAKYPEYLNMRYNLGFTCKNIADNLEISSSGVHRDVKDDLRRVKTHEDHTDYGV